MQDATVLHAVAPVDEPASAPRPLGRNEKKYQKLLDDYLGPATGIIILLLCLFVYRFDMESSEKIADHLAMNSAEQDLIIPPLAGIMDRQNWDEGTRNLILSSGDYVGLALGISSYGARVLGTLRELKGSINDGNSRNAAQQAPPVASNGHANGNAGGVLWGGQLAGFSQFAAD